MQESFTTTNAEIGSVIDYDGNTYTTVVIGTQTWMSENLKSTHYTDGTDIGEVHAYNDDETKLATYGRLYTWQAAMKNSDTQGVQGVCPTGWHLPTDTEWKTLEIYLGMTQTEADSDGFRGTNQGSKLAGRADLWIDDILRNTSGFRSSGFNALPAGYIYNQDGILSFRQESTNASFWSSTSQSIQKALGRKLSGDVASSIVRASYHIGVGTVIIRWTESVTIDYGLSVRCIKD